MTILCRCSQRSQSGLKSEGRGSGSKKFRFSRQISEKFRFFQAISQKYRFSRQISEKFQFHKTISFLPGKFPKNVYFPLNFTKHFDFQEKIGHYSYFWPNYSTCLQKSPLSNILYSHYSVHDKIRISCT